MTENGKNTVESNLSNWSYSRAIIDKLMDCAPTPVYQTKIVEKIVEVPVEVQVEKIVEKVVEKPVPQIIEVLENKTAEQQNFMQVTETKENFAQVSTKNDPQDVNFRNILNGLIKASNSTQKNDKTQENTIKITIFKKCRMKP